ncbi:MAG TPA: tRNA pseudouridine(55) synthase TruB [Nitrospirota bacterium]|nr:tRNA pseudouridine(55) synthase TruB [Nitrospirota bacterium]
MDGVLNIRKPKGWTSHDVVQKVRVLLAERRIGHTGTLDPLATGVMVLCVGKATRIARFLEAQDKEYRVVLRLGIITDTLDADGNILETRSYDAPPREDILRVIRSFTGTILQRPPAFSAVKVEGIPSYKLARRGTPVDLKPRPVTVQALRLTSYEDPFVGLAVECSKGTYVRVLCADIGATLGPGAHVVELERTRVGRFLLEHSLSLEQLADHKAAGSLENVLISMDNALAQFPCVDINAPEAERVSHGNPIPWSQLTDTSAYVRVHDPRGILVAIARTREGKLEPQLVFHEKME